MQGSDPGSVVLAGDSAGGGLALALMQTVRDAGGTLPAEAVLISPLLDLTASGASVAERADQDPLFTPEAIRSLGPAYLGEADPRSPAASPLFGSQAGLPPLLIQVGSAELLLSDSERLADLAARAGVDVTLHVGEGLPHVYHGALDTPETADAMRQIAGFVHRGRCPGREPTPASGWPGVQDLGAAGIRPGGSRACQRLRIASQGAHSDCRTDDRTQLLAMPDVSVRKMVLQRCPIGTPRRWRTTRSAQS